MEDCENILEVHMELSYKLEKFEGPLDLLLHLIEKNKVNIYDIPIAEITDQYMEYVRQMDEENLDALSRLTQGDPEKKISRLLDWAGEARDVTDPWYTGNFEKTYEDIEKGCRAVLEKLS